MKSQGTYWRKIVVTVPSEFEEGGTSLLVDLGADGVWVEERGDAVRLNIFLPERADLKIKIGAISRSLSERIPKKDLTIRTESVPEERWRSAWQAHSVPTQSIGRRLRVTRPWSPPLRNRSDRKAIQIAPGMAFGTGTHPTTRNCLLFLEEEIGKDGVGSLLDVGSGSGILSIAAVKLDARRATGVEIDPVALRTARRNARINRVASKITFRKTIPTRSRYRWVVANLTAPTLISLAPSLIKSVGKGGRLILSGILKEQKMEILKRYQRESFSLVKSRRGGEWVTLLMEWKEQ